MRKQMALSGIVGSVTMAATALTSLVLMPFVLHRVGDRVYGMWLLIGTMVGYFGLFDFGIGGAVSRFVGVAAGAGDRREVQRLFSSALKMLLWIAAGVVALTAVLIWMAGLWVKDPGELRAFRLALGLAGLGFASSFPMRAWNGTAQAHLRYDVVVFGDLLTLVVRSGLLVGALLLGWGMAGMAGASALGILAALSLAVFARRWYASDVQPSLRFADRTRMRALLGYGGFSMVATLADMLRLRIQAPAVAHYLGASAVAHYGIAATLIAYMPQLVVVLFASMNAVYARLHGAGDRAGLERTFLSATRLTIVVASFCGFGMIAWGQHFLERWVGPEFRSTYPVLVVLTVGALGELWNWQGIALLYQVGRNKTYGFVNLGEAALTLTLTFLLADRFGLPGLAVAAAAPMLVVKGLLVPWFACGAVGVSRRRYAGAALGAIARCALALAPAAAITYALVGPSYPRLLLTGMLSGLTYAAAASWLVLTPSERASVGAMLAKRLPLVRRLASAS